MSSQPVPATTIRTPTHTFTANLAPVDLAASLKKYGLGGYRAETISPFKHGPTNVDLFSFLNEGESYVPGQTMLDRSVAEIEGNRFGLPSFLALLENQSSIPVELRGKVAIVCEDVLVDEYGCRFLAFAYWDDDEQRWFVRVSRVDFDWLVSDRLGRCGK